jgi:alkylation response protein AidB-like acyl-CoA dehydrogenase
MGSSTYGQTHEVTNQAPPLERCNAMTTDAALLAAVEREGAAWHLDTLTRDGLALTHPDILALADLANRHTPEHHPFSARGERIDAIEFHPAWHTLLSMLREQGIHSLPFETATPKPGSMAARAAGYFLHAQLESGSLCPLTMTFASIPVLQQEPALYAKLKAQLLSRHHDPRDISLDASKRSMMIGMGMTEKQGGSDVRSNRTRAFPEGAGGRGGEYRLTGHKWFFSAPQCDAHLVLARTGDNTQENGPVSCFYVPRFAPDGSKNAVQVQQLKDKLGNRSNVSSEVEFLDAYGIMIGDEGRGVPTIIEMANFTRLDQRCVNARRADPGGSSRAASPGLRRKADRPAADAQRSRRSRARIRSGHRAVHATRGRIREFNEAGRTRVAPNCDAGGEVLGLQARAGIHRRGNGGLGRKRLRRNGADGAVLSRGSGEFDLGRIGECDVSRRATCIRARTRCGPCAVRFVASGGG